MQYIQNKLVVRTKEIKLRGKRFKDLVFAKEELVVKEKFIAFIRFGLIKFRIFESSKCLCKQFFEKPQGASPRLEKSQTIDLKLVCVSKSS